MPTVDVTETPIWADVVATHGDPFASSADLEHLRHPNPDQLVLDEPDDGGEAS